MHIENNEFHFDMIKNVYPSSFSKEMDKHKEFVMPSNWAKGNKKKEEAWKKSKEQFKEKHGKEPSTDDDYKEVMGIAKAIYKNMK